MRANWLYAIASLACLPVVLWLTWKDNVPPVLAAAIFFSWLAISIRVFQGNLLGVPYQQLHTYNEHINEAFCLGLVGLVVFAVGLHTNARKARPVAVTELRTAAARYSTVKAVAAYGAFLLVAPLVSRGFEHSVPGLFAPVAAVLSLKWTFFFTAFVLVVLKKECRVVFGVLVGLEFILGIGYFSGFKTILIILFLSSFCFSRKIGALGYMWLTLLLAGALMLGIVWSAVKETYRPFLSMGEQQQVVLVSRGDALRELVRQVQDLNRDELETGLDSLFSSLSYIHFFSACLGYVPDRVPHQHGRVWLDGVFHILQPRILFPDKAALDHSKQTNKYTGLALPEADQGVSASIGFFGDSYIDFGPVLMFAPIFVVGWLIGGLFRLVMNCAPDALLASAATLPVFFLANNFGLPAASLLGTIVYFGVIAAFLWKFGFSLMELLLKPAGRAALGRSGVNAHSSRTERSRRGQFKTLVAAAEAGERDKAGGG